MELGSDKLGLLTVGERDVRVTTIGYYLRKYKIDELPQLFNVLLGKMSFVGPRPEVRKYVQLYSLKQQKILTVKPGITDWASINFINENEILENSQNPEKDYINNIMQKKIELSFVYVNNYVSTEYFKIIIDTMAAADLANGGGTDGSLNHISGYLFFLFLR